MIDNSLARANHVMKAYKQATKEFLVSCSNKFSCRHAVFNCLQKIKYPQNRRRVKTIHSVPWITVAEPEIVKRITGEGKLMSNL